MTLPDYKKESSNSLLAKDKRTRNSKKITRKQKSKIQSQQQKTSKAAMHDYDNSKTAESNEIH